MNLDFEKQTLIPAIIQDSQSLQVLMLGYMNQTAFEKTKKEGRVTFFSRSKNRLWTKGESSGNFLEVEKMFFDCDRDTLLIYVRPLGPACHRGTTACFDNDAPKGFLYKLEQLITDKIATEEAHSYTYDLFRKGINKIAQKVGEEAVEVIIEAKDDEVDLFKNETADLIYHLLILLQSKGVKWEEIEEVLQRRNKSRE